MAGPMSSPAQVKLVSALNHHSFPVRPKSKIPAPPSYQTQYDKLASSWTFGDAKNAQQVLASLSYYHNRTETHRRYTSSPNTQRKSYSLYDMVDLMTSSDFILLSTWWPTQSQSRVLNHKTTQPIYPYHQDVAKQINLMGTLPWPLPYSVEGEGLSLTSPLSSMKHLRSGWIGEDWSGLWIQ